MKALVVVSKLILCSFILLFVRCETTPNANIKRNLLEIAAKKACDCDSVSVIESKTDGKTSVEITVVKTQFPNFDLRTTKIMKQMAKDVIGFCDSEEIKIHYVSNTHNVPNRTVYCECPEIKEPVAADSIIQKLNADIVCKSSSSRIAQRENGDNVLILSIRDLDEKVMTNHEVFEHLKGKLKNEYSNLCDSINKVCFEFYLGKNGYEAVEIKCEKIHN